MSQTGTPQAYRLGLIGYPLGHSFSPKMHQAALAAANLRGSYRLFSIPPGEDGRAQITDLLKQLREGTLHGLNVTIPHKQVVFGLVDRLTKTAQAVGAVNTLYMEQDRLYGDNTDVAGFLYDLGRLKLGASGRAVVLGAGGSARAIAYALASSGWQVLVLARREEQAAALAAEISRAAEIGRAAEISRADGIRGSLEAGELSTGRLAGLAFDLLVNSTPLGMHPNPEGCPWPEELPLPAGAAVYDLVYNPLETRLVRRARAAGNQAMTGAGMLAAQAALAFQRWTGLEAPYTTMERAFFDPQSDRRSPVADQGEG